MTSSGTVSLWARGFVAASACWLVIWHAAAVLGAPRQVTVTLGLLGFVDGYAPRASHLFAAGTAALLVFAVVAGRTVALAGAIGYAYLLLGLFVQRARE